MSGSPSMIPGDREADRGKCQNSASHPERIGGLPRGSGVAAAVDGLHGLGRWNIDMGLSRSFRGGAERQVQLRWEAFNVLNTVNLDNPVSTLSSPDFGKITALAAGTAPRIMQLAVKYQF